MSTSRKPLSKSTINSITVPTTDGEISVNKDKNPLETNLQKHPLDDKHPQITAHSVLNHTQNTHNSSQNAHNGLHRHQHMFQIHSKHHRQLLSLSISMYAESKLLAQSKNIMSQMLDHNIPLSLSHCLLEDLTPTRRRRKYHNNILITMTSAKKTALLKWKRRH